MPRSSNRRPAPAPRATPRPSAQQTRPNATLAPARPAAMAPPHAPHAGAAPVQSQGPGLFGQMASTAAGVAVGSSIGHAVGSLFTGAGGQSVAASDLPPAAVEPVQRQVSGGFDNCSAVFKMFTQCMEQNNNDGNACNWYIQQLKSCQDAQH